MTNDRKNFFISLMVMPFLVLNVVFPKNISLEIDRSTFDELLKSESAVLSYCSFAVIPLKIVNELLSQYTSSGESSKKSKNQDKKSSDNATDLCTVGLKSFKKGSDIKRDSPKLSKCVAIHSLANYFRCFESPIGAVFDRGKVFLLLVMNILLLPRGSIEDATQSLSQNISNTAIHFWPCFFIFKNLNAVRGNNGTIE